MQYIRENRDGSRSSVSDWDYLRDSQGPDKDDLVYYMRTDAAVIYHMQGPGFKAPVGKPLRFGGRGKPGSIWNGA